MCFVLLGKKKPGMIWQRMKLAINDKEFLLTSELVVSVKMNGFLGTHKKKHH